MNGADIKRLRKKLKDSDGRPATQQSLATTLGIALSTISALEQNPKRNVSRLVARLVVAECQKQRVKV